jgi:hypothetical protein
VNILIFLVQAPCSQLNSNSRFGATCRLHLGRLGISRERRRCEVKGQTEQLDIFLYPEDGRHIPPKLIVTFSGLSTMISQKRKRFTLLLNREHWIVLKYDSLRFEVFTAVTMKNGVLSP